MEPSSDITTFHETPLHALTETLKEAEEHIHELRLSVSRAFHDESLSDTECCQEYDYAVDGMRSLAMAFALFAKQWVPTPEEEETVVQVELPE